MTWKSHVNRSPEPTNVERGPRARTRRLMLDTAIRLMQAGVTPSVSEVAEAAGVSRATAYRYFPSQAALVQAVVDAGLGPILDWRSDATDAEARVSDLIDTALPRIDDVRGNLQGGAQTVARPVGAGARPERSATSRPSRAAIASTCSGTRSRRCATG